VWGETSAIVKQTEIVLRKTEMAGSDGKLTLHACGIEGVHRLELYRRTIDCRSEELVTQVLVDNAISETDVVDACAPTRGTWTYWLRAYSRYSRSEYTMSTVVTVEMDTVAKSSNSEMFVLVEKLEKLIDDEKSVDFVLDGFRSSEKEWRRYGLNFADLEQHLVSVKNEKAPWDHDHRASARGYFLKALLTHRTA
jgi:hypothetical protein